MTALQEYGLREPEFIDMEIAFRVNLYRMVEEEGLSILKTDQGTNQAADQTNQDTNQVIDQVSIKANWSDAELKDKDKVILLLIKNQLDITQTELASQLDWTIASVKYYMTKRKGQHVICLLYTSILRESTISKAFAAFTLRRRRQSARFTAWR